MEEPVRALVAFGTRPEAVKMAPVVRALGADPAFDVRVLSTAQHREMLDQVTRLFGLRVDYDLDAMRERQALPGLTARILEGAADVLGGAPPTSCSCTATPPRRSPWRWPPSTPRFPSATWRQAALAPPLGALPRGDEPSPRLDDRHLALRPPPSATAPTSSPRAPRRATYGSRGTRSSTRCCPWWAGLPLPRAPELGRVDFAGRRVIGLTCHRRENLGAPLARMLAAVRDEAAARDDVEVVFPVHRNPAVREVAERELGGAPRVHLVEPLDYGDFSNLMARCSLMLTDSGGVQEEAPALDVPVIVLRDVTERPEAVEAGCALLAGTTYEGVRRSLGALLDDAALYARMAAAPDPYGDGHAAERIRAALRETFGRA